jgi:RNA polymerase sigma-70 factor (ECF subfamily)
LTGDIVERARAGDRARLDDLYRRVAPSIHAWASLRLRGPAGRFFQAEDIVQEAWLRALRDFDTYDPERAPFRRWIYGIVHNVMREALHAAGRLTRRRGRASREGSTIFDVAHVPAEITTLSRRVARDQELQAFMERIQKLETAERELLSLRGLEGLPFEEIARFLQIGAAAARKRWERLRAKLARIGAPIGLFDDAP